MGARFAWRRACHLDVAKHRRVPVELSLAAILSSNPCALCGGSRSAVAARNDYSDSAPLCIDQYPGTNCVCACRTHRGCHVGVPRRGSLRISALLDFSWARCRLGHSRFLAIYW